MKIAVPTMGKEGLKEVIGQHFGRVPTYTIVDTETNELRVIENTSHHMGGRGYPPEILSKAGVEVLLCSGLGSRAIGMFKEYEIRVYVGAFSTVKDAINSFKAGELREATESDSCTQHAFRGPFHGTGLCKKK